MGERREGVIIEGYASIPLVADAVPPARDWVFCLGLARSGSTALCRLVSRHPDALLLNEAGLFMHSLLLRSEMLRLGSGQKIHNAELVHAMTSEGIPASLVREMMEQVRGRIRGAPLVFGDKLGAYASRLTELLTVFPDCRLLAADRDEWDAAASFMDLEWYRSRNRSIPPEQLARRTLDACRAERDRLADIRREHEVFVVGFEQMASSPEQTLNELFGFLGLDPGRYDYEAAIAETNHAAGIGHWERVPEIRQLRGQAEDASPVAGESAEATPAARKPSSTGLLIGAHDWFGSRAVLPAAHLLAKGTVVIGEGAQALYDRFGVRYDEIVADAEEYFELVDAHAGPFIGPVPTMHPLTNPDAKRPDQRSTLSDCFRPRNPAHAIPLGSWEAGAPIMLLKGPNYDARSLHYTGDRALIKGYGDDVDCWREERNVEFLPIEGLYYRVFDELAACHAVGVEADVVWFDRGIRVRNGELDETLAEVAAARDLTIVRNGNVGVRREYQDAWVPWLESESNHCRLERRPTEIAGARVAYCQTPVEAEDYQRGARLVLGIENCFSGAFLMATMFEDTHALWFHETADRLFLGSEDRARELRKALNRLAETGRVTKVTRGCSLEAFAVPRDGFAGNPVPVFLERAQAMLSWSWGDAQ